MLAIFSILGALGERFEVLELVKSYNMLRKIAIIVFLFWFLMRFISSVEANLAKQDKMEKQKQTTLRAFSQLIRITAIVVAFLIFLQTIGVEISALLAFGGIGTLAVGLAAKDNLANLLSGFMIFLDRPFCVGDWVRSPDKEIEGTVEHIGWRLTRIRTFDKRPLYVPNGIFSTVSLENPSRMSNRRIKTTIGLRYDDATKMKTVLSAIEDMLRNHPEIDTRQTLMVNLFEFGPSSLNFFIYTFTKTTDWVKFQAIQQDVFLKIIEIITNHGAEIAFPTRTIQVPEGINSIGALEHDQES